jgi:hypothetical protein
LDTRTARALAPHVIEPLATFPVKVLDGRIYVQVTKEQAEGA